MILTTPNYNASGFRDSSCLLWHAVKFHDSLNIHCMKRDGGLKLPFPSPTAVYTAAHWCLYGLNLNNTSSKKSSLGTSLVAQWLRIHLPMQRMQVQLPVWGTKILHAMEQLSPCLQLKKPPCVSIAKICMCVCVYV